MIIYLGFFLLNLLECAFNSIRFSYTFVPLFHLIFSLGYVGINYAGFSTYGSTTWKIIDYQDFNTVIAILVLEFINFANFFFFALANNAIKDGIEFGNLFDIDDEDIIDEETTEENLYLDYWTDI